MEYGMQVKMFNKPALVLDNIIQSRAGGRVQRAHGIPHHGSYSNAEHQWGVAMLLRYLWPEDFARLALHALSHDVPEAWVGDIPAPTMRYLPGLKERLHPIEGNINRSMGLPGEDELGPEDLSKIKACDRLELYIWCREQMHMGNEYARECMMELDRFFTETPLPGPAAALHKEIQDSDDLLPRQAGVMKAICEAR